MGTGWRTRAAIASAAESVLQGFQKIIVVEQNATGQFAGLLRAELGLEAAGRIRSLLPGATLLEVSLATRKRNR